MPFEWLPTKEAADALSVDVATLQAWIDSGRAPSRRQNGRVEVLIEFDADEQAADKAGSLRDQSSPAFGSSAAKQESSDDASSATSQDSAEHDPAFDGRPHTEVVLARELQLAAGCVAAWQRLAEHADGELTRTRRTSIIAWSLVAALVLISVIGVWWSTKTISDGRAETGFVKHQLDGTSQTASDRLTRISELEVKAQRLSEDLAKARDTTSEAEHRAAVAQVRVDQLTALNKQLEQLGAQRVTEHEAVVASLRSTNTEQASRITRLEGDLKSASEELATVRKQLTEAQATAVAAARDLAQSRKETTAAQQLADEAEQRAVASQQRAEKADKSLAEVQQRQSAGEAKQVATSEALSKAVAERDAIKAQLDTETSGHAQTRATLSQLEARVKSLEADLKAAREASKTPPTPTMPSVDAVKPQATADAGKAAN